MPSRDLSPMGNHPTRHLMPRHISISRLLHTLIVACTVLVLPSKLLAVAPKAPTITKVDFSLAGIDNTGATQVGTRHSYLVQWTDNSLDEEGFDVQVRAGSDPFTTFSRIADNGTQAALIGVTALNAGTVVQFQVVAWKFNGAKIETGTSAVFSFNVPEATAEGTLNSPANLVLTNVDDSRIKLAWTDRTNSEIFYQIDVKETTAVAFQGLTFVNHSGNNFSINPTLNPTNHTFRLRLVPNTDYEFRVRATRQQNVATSQASLYSNTATIRTPVLTPPSNLGAQLLAENLVRLRWLDNSTNETGYEIQYRDANGSGDFAVRGSLGEGSTTVDIPVPQGSSIEWRVLALYTYTPSGSTTATTVRSAPSNTVTFSTSFPAPTNLQAVGTGLASTIDLTWEDNTSTEYGFNVYTRPEGTTTWYFARAVREGVEKVSVNSRTESNDATGKPVFITLETGVTHEFIVFAVAADETNVSLDSNVATAVANHGFTSRLYQPIQQGQSFGYLATTTNADNRTDWSITGLPTGLTFDSGTGAITGTPSVAGLFQCQMTAQFTNSPNAAATLVLRVLKAISGPYVTKAIPSTTIGINAPFRVPLADKFADNDAETAVRLETNRGNIDISLFPSLAPVAVANFLSYVNAGDYNNMVFHRLVNGFVLQGGSMRPLAAPRTFVSIPSRPPATNEPGITNVRGIVAAAKVGARNSIATLTTGNVAKDDSFGYVGNPDSATTDFFINLANNVANLDNQNGGFTAFGRVSLAGMAVADNIASLPIGSYLNNNTTETYNASLDKRIILDGSFTPFSGIPMIAATAPADMDINKTVKVTKAALTPTMRYSLSTNPPGVATVEVEGNELKITGKTEGSTTVTVIAADLDNNSISQTFNVIVSKLHKAPAITKHPVTQAVVAGSKVTFSVTATGSNLTYQWRKKVGVALPVNVDGATKNTLIIPNAQAGDVALYDVLVTNATTTLTSNAAALDLRSAPTVGTLAESKLVEVGKALTLTVNNVTGAPAPTFAWKRGTAAVAGQTKSTLNIAAAKLTDAGTYTATASNIVSKATTGSVNVFVVDKAVKPQVFTQNKTITLTAPIAGSGIIYRWHKDGSPIPLNQPRFSGMEDPILKITASTLDDTGSYTCLATLPDALGSVFTGAIELFIVTRPVLPQLTGINAPPTAFVGVDYSWKLPFSELPAHTPTSFSIAGLPTGLKLNTTTGIISGRATKVGIHRLTATARNAAGTSTPAAVGDLTVSPLPSSNVGSFTGTIAPSLILNQNKGGRIDLTVLDTGAYTGKIVLGAETINAAGALGAGVGLFNASSITYQSRIEVKRKDKSVLILTFEIDASFGYVSGVVSNGVESAAVSGFRQFWDEKWNPCTYGGSPSLPYNMAMNLAETDIGKANVPQGSGYLNMLVSTKGIATFSGRMADGTTITSSSTVGPAGEAMLFLMLYKNTGSVLAQINIGDTPLNTGTSSILRVDGEVRWLKDGNQPVTERNHQAGIPETYLDVLGAIYTKPGTNQIVMGLPNVADNTRIDFSEGGISTSPRNPDRTVRITTANTVAYPTTPISDAKTTLLVNSTTGSISGSFQLLDGTVTRTVPYQGLIIPTIPHTPAVTNTSGVVTSDEISGSGAFAAGYFLLPELLPSVTKSKINSGKVFVEGAPITITTQPVDQAVNPAANVSFTVGIAAGSQGTVTYRWRKNGNSIAGATTNVLNLGAVTESSQGDYDCIISNGSFTIASEAATLSVNDPVTNVTISRTPAASVLASNQTITFTASAQGTAQLIYQWRKDNVDIFGATNPTYVISSATTGDTGSYTVHISNTATPAGVTSSADALTVADIVVITSAGRTPDTTNVTTSTEVTFSVTATGTGTLTYQWRKNNVAIDGATSSTYTLPAASLTDTGDYNVLVKNIISTAGVSNPTDIRLDVVDP